MATALDRVSIRAALATDAQTIAKHIHSHRDATANDVAVYTKWLESAIHRDIYIGFVAIHNERTISGAGVILFELGPIRGTTNPIRGRLTAVFTEPEFRGRGLAKEVCQRAIGAARARGIEVFSLAATDLGRSVYERLGFTPYPGEMRLVSR